MPHHEFGSASRFASLCLALDILASFAMIAAAATLYWGESHRPPAQAGMPQVKVPQQPLSLEGAPTIGASTARVVVIEYSDFECPYCAKFATTVLPSLKAQYIDKGLVRLAFRFLPLPTHPGAIPAATAAECAARQNRFWPMHDRLFLASKPSTADFGAHALAVGLEVTAFSACRATMPTQQVTADIESAKALGVMSTPTFFVGTLMPHNRVQVTSVVSGARPLADFARPIDKLIQKRS